ncbi:hypothetical protein [Halanaerobaculum tunisiense]
MGANNKAEVIVRGIKSKWFEDNFIDMKVYFSSEIVPKKDADFIGFYIEAPRSAITHIGVVESIDRNNKNKVIFHLKAIIKLDNPIDPGHQIRNFEYKTLEDLGINKLTLLLSEFSTAETD